MNHYLDKQSDLIRNTISNTRNIRSLPLLIGCLVSSVYAGQALAVPGVTYLVNSTSDLTDISPGDGICNTGGTPPPGHTYQCTLRAAIQESNAHFPNAASDPDVVTIPAGTYAISISGRGEDNSATGDFDVRDHLRINGAADTTTIINAQGFDRAFHVMSGYTVEINDLAINNGTAPYYYYPEGHGGGIHNLGALTLNDVTVEGNNAAYEGGGVYNTGTLIVNGSRIVYNTGAGGISNQASGQLTVEESVVAGNSSGGWGVAGMGGGIRSFGIALMVKKSLIAGNSARDGGGMYFGGYATPSIENVTVSGNSATRYGGGIHARNKANIKSSTITNNYASQNGGGLYVFNSSSSSNAIVTLHNTITAGNSKGWSVANDCSVPPNESGSTNYATLTSLGYNIDQDNSCHLTATGDQPSTTPLLGPLAANGGPTDTHALQTGSPAIDSGATVCPATDQRGISRPQDGNGDGTATCDIGAYEKN